MAWLSKTDVEAWKAPFTSPGESLLFLGRMGIVSLAAAGAKSLAVEIGIERNSWSLFLVAMVTWLFGSSLCLPKNPVKSSE